MSFDLAVLHSEKALSNEEALEIYTKLCEEGPYLEGVSSKIEEFYLELTGIWPEIDAIPEEKVGDFDDCPWSCALDRSEMAVVISCVWPKAEEVRRRVAELAEKHDLVLFNPQMGKIEVPASLLKRRAAWLRRLLG